MFSVQTSSIIVILDLVGILGVWPFQKLFLNLQNSSPYDLWGLTGRAGFMFSNEFLSFMEKKG